MNAAGQMIEKVRVRAPGTLMLMGEHAVLHGHCALACAVNRFVDVRISRRKDASATIKSALGNYSFSLKDNAPAFPKNLRFACEALYRYVPHLGDRGVDVEIESEFSSTVGLGSSAAVTVGVASGMRAVCGMDMTPDAVFSDAYNTVLKVQGRGSGTDVAACVSGGITRYRISPQCMESMPLELPLLLVYCGYKTRTTVVIERIEQQREKFPEIYEKIFSAVGACSEAGWKALLNNDLDAFGKLVDVHQELMRALSLNTPELDEIVTGLRALPDVKGAKITGSGLGDCVLAIGSGNWLQEKYPVLPVEISRKGVTVDY